MLGTVGSKVPKCYNLLVPVVVLNAEVREEVKAAARAVEFPPPLASIIL